MIKDTAKTLDETVAAANESAELFRQTVEDMKEAAPQTAEVLYTTCYLLFQYSINTRKI